MNAPRGLFLGGQPPGPPVKNLVCHKMPHVLCHNAMLRLGVAPNLWSAAARALHLLFPPQSHVLVTMPHVLCHNAVLRGSAAQCPTVGQRLHALRLLFFTSISLVLATTSLEQYPLSLLSLLFVLSNPPSQLLISTSKSVLGRHTSHMS